MDIAITATLCLISFTKYYKLPTYHEHFIYNTKSDYTTNIEYRLLENSMQYSNSLSIITHDFIESIYNYQYTWIQNTVHCILVQ